MVYLSLTIPAGNFCLEDVPRLCPASNLSEALAFAEVTTRLSVRASSTAVAAASDSLLPLEVYQWAVANRDALWHAGDGIYPTAKP